MGTYAPLLRRTLEYALEYLEGLPDAPVDATVGLETLRARLCKPLPPDALRISGLVRPV